MNTLEGIPISCNDNLYTCSLTNKWQVSITICVLLNNLAVVGFIWKSATFAR